jgi:hypothetical protein
MANMFFNQKALEKMRKADDLEAALQISNPGVILTLLACAALLIGVFSWGIFGSVHTDIDVIAVKLADSPDIACIVDIHDLSEIKEGDRVTIKGKTFRVASLSTNSVKRDDVQKLTAGDEYMTEAIMGDRNYGYSVIITGDDMSDIIDGEILSATIIAGEQSPISLLFG